MSQQQETGVKGDLIEIKEVVKNIENRVETILQRLSQSHHHAVTTPKTDEEIQAFLTPLFQSCVTIRDVDAVYYNPFYQSCLSSLEVAQLGKDRNVWAKEWAEKLSRGDADARRLNIYRRLCLLLLYAMCDLWKPEDANTPPTISDADIVRTFKPQKVHRILRACLPMDRANALYNMIDGATNQRGMHWYSKRDRGLLETWRANFGQDRMNQPTMNKRLTWLFDLEGLGLSQEEDLVKIMEPCRTPLATME